MTIIDEVHPDRLLTPARRLDTACRRVTVRADVSEQPHRYYRLFEEGLGRIRSRGVGEVLDTMPAWQDPVYLAAEIEALAATRFMATLNAAMAAAEAETEAA